MTLACAHERLEETFCILPKEIHEGINDKHDKHESVIAILWDI